MLLVNCPGEGGSRMNANRMTVWGVAAQGDFLSVYAKLNYIYKAWVVREESHGRYRFVRGSALYLIKLSTISFTEMAVSQYSRDSFSSGM